MIKYFQPVEQSMIIHSFTNSSGVLFGKIIEYSNGKIELHISDNQDDTIIHEFKTLDEAKKYLEDYDKENQIKE